MLIAVLGVSSFSGTAFAKYVEREGHSVMPLRRPRFDLNAGMEPIMRALDEAKPEVFVNFAALNMVGESWQFYYDYYRTNVIGVARLADELSRRKYLRKFVQVSTPEVYGQTATEMLKEGAPFCPSTPYAISRAAADMHLAALHSVRGFPVCFTRTVNVYGPAQQTYRIIPKTVLSIARGWKLKLHGGGITSRAFIHIDDVAAATLLIAREGKPGETYHIATPGCITIRGVVMMICGLVKKQFGDLVEIDLERPGKDNTYLLDDSKIRGMGWQHKTDFAEGLAATVDWFWNRADEYAGHPLEYTHRP